MSTKSDSPDRPRLDLRKGPVWTKGVSFKLARIAVIVAFLLGLVLSSLQVLFDYFNQLGELDRTVERILRVAEAPARRAAFELNRDLAQEVVSGLLEYDFISHAAIREISSGILAEESGPQVEPESGWGLSGLFDGSLDFSVSLLSLDRSEANQAIALGRLELTVNRLVALDPFIRRASLIIVSGVVRSLVLAVLLWAVFYFLISRSLVAIERKLRRIDPTRPKEVQLATSAVHKEDEIGLLTESVNTLLRLIDTHLQRLKASEQALRESEVRFRDIAEAASDWFWETDGTGAFSFVSDRFPAITGRRQEDLIAKSPALLENPEAQETGWLEFDQMLALNRPFRDHRCRLRDSEGRHRWFAISGKPIFDEANLLIGYRGAASDITGEVEAENRMRQAQKMEAIGQLTGGIAHDFNNLLTVIIGNLELVSERSSQEKRNGKLLRSALEAADRGSSLTHRLLAFSRKQPLDAKPVDAGKLVRGMDDLIRRTLGGAIDIELVISGGLWLCDVDTSQLESALLNLAINARDAMPDGGKLTIETGNVRIDDDYAEQTDDLRPGQYVLVAVSDTGHGMSQDTIGRIFEPFFTTKKIGKGSGLGLSMVYGFAKQSGGNLTVYSELGEGTTFKIYLPRSRASQAAVRRDEIVLPEPSAAQESVLVVEDDPDICQLVATILSNAGYQVITAASGPAALELLADGTEPELLLTDAILPGGMSGAELAETLKKRLPLLKLLFMSGYSGNAIAHGGHLGPGVRLLPKPFSKIDLLRKVRAALDEST